MPISTTSALGGTLVVTVVDRTGVAVRTLPPIAVAAGTTTTAWDGLDAAGGSRHPGRTACSRT